MVTDNQIANILDTQLLAALAADAPDFIEYDNVQLDACVTDYAVETFLLQFPKNVETLGENYETKKSGVYQVNICTPVSVGRKRANDISALLEAHFKPGVVFSSGGVNLRIRKCDPYPALKNFLDEKYRLPVRIEYLTFFF